jgi:peptide/nickel transport system substrate-binding protein
MLIMMLGHNVLAADSHDTLRLIFWQAPTVLNPYISGADKDLNVCRLFYEPLATFDKDGQLVPVLAAEVPSLENGGVAPDGKSVVWKLKPGVTWSDGHPFTAEDVKFTYEFIINPKTESQSVRFYRTIDHVEIIDELTVKIHFNVINPEWFDMFVGKHGTIIPRHIFEPYIADIQNAPANMKPVGTGPYRLISFNTEDMLLIGEDLINTVKLISEPNPLFREQDKPYFQRLEIHGGGDAKTAARAVLVDGIADYAWNLQVEATTLSTMTQAGQGKIVVIPKPYVEKILVNQTDPNRETETGERSSLRFPHPFFRDKRIRQALAHAIPREQIALLYGKTATPTTNELVAPPVYNSPNTAQLYPFDLKRAVDLLDQAGWIDSDGDGIRDKDGVKMHILFQTSVNPIRQQTQRIVKETLMSIGIEVELKVVDASVFFPPDPANPNNTQHFYADLQEYYTGTNTPAVRGYMKKWTCDQIPQQSNNWSVSNNSRWCNPSYDALYEQTATELNPEKRREIFIRMNDILIEDVGIIPLVRRAVLSGISNTLTGIDFTPWDADTWNIQDWRRQ